MYMQIINRLRSSAGAVARGTAALGLAGLLALGAVAPNEVEAKRVGSSQSIGRQSQTASPSGQGQRSQQAQSAQQTGQTAGATGSSRWMGPLAGLAAGLGIAALLSSFGLAEGLAQMLANALLIGLMIAAGVMLLRFIANRRRANLAYPANGLQKNNSSFSNQVGQSPPGTSLRDWPRAAMGATGVKTPEPALADQAAFLVSAKAMFMRLQSAWDRNEQGDLFELTTPEMFMRLKQDLEERGREPSRTDVTHLEAEVVGTESNKDEMLVSVRFYGDMREDDAPTAEPFQEIWNLVSRGHGDQAWRLAGIQQISH